MHATSIHFPLNRGLMEGVCRSMSSPIEWEVHTHTHARAHTHTLPVQSETHEGHALPETSDRTESAYIYIHKHIHTPIYVRTRRLMKAGCAEKRFASCFVTSAISSLCASVRWYRNNFVYARPWRMLASLRMLLYV